MQTNISPSVLEDPDGFFSDGTDVAVPATSAPNASILDKPDDVAGDILDGLNEPARTDDAPVDTSAATAALAALDEELLGADDELEAAGADSSRPGRPRTDKSAMVDATKKLIEDGALFVFEDEVDGDGKVVKKAKALEDYTSADFVELFKANIKEREDELKEKTPKEFFDSLPTQLQYATKYFTDGGKDIVGLFKALGEVEETRALDATKPLDQKQIVRQYLQTKKVGSAEDIEDQVADLEAAGTLEKWALKYKPELDGMEEQRIQQKLVEQEQIKQRNQQRQQQYLSNVRDALKDGKLGNTKIETKRRDQLWGDLTQLNHTLANGTRTNKLGHLLEQVQFGEEPNYDLLAQVTWLLDDPKGFHEHFAKESSNQVAIETARKLKTAEAQKKAGGTGAAGDDPAPEPTRRTIKRPINILTGRPE